MHLAPKKVIKALDKIRRDFIWGRKAGRYKIRWVAWQKMIRPKQQGGFGLGDLRSTNLALLIKWWWKLKTKPEELWVKVINSIHGSNKSHKIIPINNKFTGTWKDIVSAGNELGSIGISVSDEIIAEVGSGNEVKFWIDNWCDGKRFKERFPGLFKIARNKHVRVVDCFTKLDSENQWNLGWLRPPDSDEEWAQWTIMLHLLNNVKFKPGADRWAWKSNDKGEFTVAAVRNQITKQDGTVTEEEWKYFTWKAMLERIPVKKELTKRRIPIDNQLCSRCETEEETVDHVICGCNNSKTTWREILGWIKLSTSAEFRGVKEALDHVDGLTGSKEWKKIINAVFQTTIWNIWKARNEKEFEGKTRSGVNIAETTMTDSFVWLKSRSKFQELIWERWVDFNIRDIVK
ncbi:putative reverse transcriptase zinc-binding domain-containing protein [Helianthus annuus]|nr:putative reverse transcriptase zinc-binding domain-containing protein [Helianthus annuus]